MVLGGAALRLTLSFCSQNPGGLPQNNLCLTYKLTYVDIALISHICIHETQLRSFDFLKLRTFVCSYELPTFFNLSLQIIGNVNFLC